MLNEHEILFIKLLLERNLLSLEQFGKILSAKKRYPQQPIWNTLLHQNLLPPHFIKKHYEILQRKFQQNYLYTAQDIYEKLLCQLAIKQNYLKSEDVQKLLQQQKQAQLHGKFPALEELLLHQGILSAEKINFLKTHILHSYFICSKCHFWQKLDAKKTINCPHCTSPNSSYQPGKQPYSQAQTISQTFSNSSTTLINSPQKSTLKISDLAPPQKNYNSFSENPPQKFGRYTILKKIASGGMGIVYLAWDPILKRKVALKTLFYADENDKNVQRFLREAQAVAKLRHPNIIRIYDIGIEEDNHYFTMDFVQGCTWDKYLQKHQPNLNTILKKIQIIAEAVHYGHSHNIIHRDIKPSNIMVNEELQPILMDFGLAKRVDSETSLTKTGTTIGTPSYMPPEQAAGELDKLCFASDVYSLGCVLYESLTGQRAFDGPTTVSILYKVLKKEPISPRKINPKIPQEIENIVLKAMEKDIASRYTTAKDFSQDIENFLQGKPIEARAADWKYRLKKTLLKKRTYLAGSLFLAMVVGIVLYFGYSKLDRTHSNLRKKLEKQRFYYLLEKGKRLLDRGEFLLAKKNLEKAAEIQQNPELTFYQGQLFFQMHDYNKAKKFLRLASNSPKYSTQANFILGKITQKNSLTKAIAYYQKALQNNPKHLPSLWQLAQIYKKLQKNTLHQHYLKKWQQEKQKEAEKHFQQAQKCMKQKEYLQALYFLQHAISYLKDKAPAYFNIAQCYQKLGQPKRGINYIQKAIQLSPNSILYRTLLAELYLKMNLWRDAISLYQTILPQKPLDITLKLAYIYLEREYYQKSFELFQKAHKKLNSLQKNPRDYYNLYRGYGILFAKVGQYQKGLDFLKKALTSGSGDATLFQTMAEIYTKMKRFPKALKCLQLAYQKSPSDQLLLKIAENQINLKNFDLALQTLEKVKRKSFLFYYHKAKIFLGKNNPLKALQNLEKAQNFCIYPPKDFYELRGDIYFAQKFYQQSYHEYLKAVKADERNLSSFIKALKVSVVGFLWEKILQKVAKNSEWLTSFPQKLWSYKISLFSTEETQLLEQYSANIKKTQRKTKTISPKNILEIIQSLEKESNREIAKDWLIAIGKPALPFLYEFLEKKNFSSQPFVKEIISCIEREKEEKEIHKLSYLLAQIYIHHHYALREKIWQIYGKKRNPLLKKILQSSYFPILLRLYAALELYDFTNPSIEQYFKDLAASKTTTGVLAALAMVQSYQGSRFLQSALLEGLRSAQPLLQALCLENIELTPKVRPLIEEWMEKTSDSRVRLICASRLYLHGENSGLGVLQEFSKWVSPKILIYLCQVLSQKIDERALPILKKFLSHPNPEIRLAAVVALRFYPKKVAEKLLIPFLNPTYEKNMEIRLQAITILTRRLSQKAFPYLFKILTSPKEDIYLRFTTLTFFQNIKNPILILSLANSLNKLLRDPNPIMRSLVMVSVSLVYHVLKFPLPTSFLKGIEENAKDPKIFVQVYSHFALGILNVKKYKSKFLCILQNSSNKNLLFSAGASLTALYHREGKSLQYITNKLSLSSLPYARHGGALYFWFFAKNVIAHQKLPLPKIAEKQVAFYKKSLQLNPTHHFIYLDLASAYTLLNKEKEALKSLYQGIQLINKNYLSSALFRINKILKHFGKWNILRQITKSWVKKFPNTYIPYYYLGLISEGKEKIKNFRYALFMLKYPRTPREFLHKSFILSYFGLEKESLKNLQKGVKELGHSRLYKSYIYALFRRKKYKKALEMFQAYSFLKQGKIPLQLRYLCGISYYHTGKYEKSIKDLEYFLKKKHGSSIPPDTYLALAYSYEAFKNHPKAEFYLKKLLKYTNTSPQYYLTLAEFYHRHNKLDIARNYLLVSLRFYNCKPKALALLSLNYALRSQLDNAKKYLQSSLNAGFQDFTWLKKQQGFLQIKHLLPQQK